jgi:hypothetical protein
MTYRCTRCGETGDPRSCNCMRRLGRYLDDAAREITLGRPLRADRCLAQARGLLSLMRLDGEKASGRGSQASRRAA